MIRTRFAPSPTGFLHIGGARTALFNYLFAKANGGDFLLRVEDTDKARSSEEATQAILNGMAWMGLPHDGEVVFQSQNETRHREVAEQLLAEGKAYKCFCTKEELQQMREEAEAAKQGFKYDRRWRDKDASEAPDGADYAIRIKAPLEGELTFTDAVQGEMRIACDELDDFIILRSDGTPTYMLAVVVDDHDMDITHVIRGDDHLNNASRQAVIFNAMGWDLPTFAHISLIHGPDGAKLSKRHGALGIEAYREMGYLPEALRNYLLRLGWSHGDDEIISDAQAIEWFTLEAINKAPARIDFDKMANVNGQYIREADNARLYELAMPFFADVSSRGLTAGSLNSDDAAFDETVSKRLRAAMEGLKQRAKTLQELAESGAFYMLNVANGDTLPIQNEKAQKLLDESKELIGTAAVSLASLDNFTHDALYAWAQNFSESQELKLGKLMNPIRAAITGSNASPSMFEVLEILGKDETLARLKSAS